MCFKKKLAYFKLSFVICFVLISLGLIGFDYLIKI